MSTPRVKAYFDGLPETGGEVYLDDLSSMCSQISACLRATEEVITESKPKSRYRLTSLGTGSISFSLEPSNARDNLDVATSAITLFNQTIEALQKGLPIDSRIGRSALEVYKRLADSILCKSRIFQLSDITITTQFIAQIDKLLGKEIISEGSFKGRIERINIHNKKNECALYSPLRQKGITCTFDKELFKQVHAAIDQNVTVTGTMYFEDESAFPSRICIKGIQIHTHNDALPTLRSLKGLIGPEATNNMSVHEFIQAVRNG